MRRAARARRLNAKRGESGRSNTSSAIAGASSALAPGGAGGSYSATVNSGSNNNNNSSSSSSSGGGGSGSNSSSNNGVFTLIVHGPEFNNGENVVLNPECFPGIKPMDLVELRQPERTHPRLIVQVASMAPVRGKLQVSLLRELAAQFGLEAFQPVVVCAVDARSATIDYMELTFKDQFLSGAEIWRVKVALFGKCVYVGKTVECLGIRSQVEGLLAAGAPAVSGVVGDATRIIVRSRSSRLFWLVQVSAEMWEFAPDGELYYEKLLDQLLRDMVARWTAASVSHSITIIAFSRAYYDAEQFPRGFDPREPPFSSPSRQFYCAPSVTDGVPAAVKRYAPTIHVDPSTGRLYEDFYKVIVLSYTGTDWGHLRSALRHEFATYHTTHRWRGPDEFMPAEYEILGGREPREIDDGGERARDGHCDARETTVKWTRLPFGVPSRAADGNVLEAINVTLNVLDKHHMDRDLNRTGQSIVMVTAGCSIFNVREQLAESTQQRMMDSGVGMDMISLAAPPLHVVPLFIYRTPRPPGSPARDGHEGERVDAGAASANDSALRNSADSPLPGRSCRYQVPHWVNITFLDFDCKCSANSSKQQPPLQPPGRQGAGSASQLFSHRAHSCQCQCQRSREFIPLPPFRMFDVSAPRDKVSPLPAALRNIIPGYPRRVETVATKKPTTKQKKQKKQKKKQKKEKEEEEESILQCLEEELKSLETAARTEDHESSLLRRPTSVESEANDRASLSGKLSMFPPDEWQLSRTPDYAPSIPPEIKRATTNLNLSLLTREALLEYDDEEAPDDITSVTFDGDMSNLLKADQRRALHRSLDWANVGAYGTRQLRMASPSKFTATGMKRGQSEIFALSTPFTPAVAMHSRGAPIASHSGNDAAGGETKKRSINPFRYSAEALDPSSQRLSVDRRRWSHMFPVLYHLQDQRPSGNVLDRSTMRYIGPNWKSLVTPAILPLTTDYFPSPKELRDSYAESFYTLTLPSTSRFDSVPKYNNHDELLIEMICQRLSCDFQLVTSGDRSRQAASASSAAGSGGGGQYSTRRLDQAPDSHTIVYHLSTVHRIHQLIYDPERQTIEVKQFVQRPAVQQRELAMPALAPPSTESAPYRYSIWVDATQAFHPLRQEFHRVPTHDENWNATDLLLCGYHDSMSDRSKCRRIRFAIVPPAFPDDHDQSGEATEVATTHAAKFARFLDYLQSRVAPNDDGSVETIAVAVELDADGVHHRPAVVLPKGFNSRCYKVCCRTSSASALTSTPPSSSTSSTSTNTVAPGGSAPAPPLSSGSKTRSEDTRTEWVMLNLEDTMDVARTYHLDVRWLACSGMVADEFVSAVKRKAKQAGLELRRVPEYSSVPFLQIHPLIAPVLLPFPAPVVEAALAELEGDGNRKSRVVQMIEALGFVLDDERIADSNGIGFGLGIEREGAADTTASATASTSGATTAPGTAPAARFQRRSASLTTRILLAKFRTRGYQQFMHRQLPVFVRVTHTGLVWVPSYEYEEKMDSSRTTELFHALSDQLQAC